MEADRIKERMLRAEGQAQELSRNNTLLEVSNVRGGGGAAAGRRNRSCTRQHLAALACFSDAVLRSC
jgi:hypothetical protein